MIKAIQHLSPTTHFQPLKKIPPQQINFPYLYTKANQSIAVRRKAKRGKSGQYRTSCFLTGRSFGFKIRGTESAAERKTTLGLLEEKVKRCGKSAPLRWRHRRQGKPHELKDHVNWGCRSCTDERAVRPTQRVGRWIPRVISELDK